jgi:hypothetical protein
LLVTLADDLEEQIRAGFVDGQLAQFVHGQNGGFEVMAARHYHLLRT